jgi:hypothetical protein
MTNRFDCPHVEEIASTTLAGRTSYRISISWNAVATGSFAYTFGEWAEEDMASGNVEA